MFLKVMAIILIVLAALFVLLGLLALLAKPASVYAHEPQKRNPMEGRKVRFVEDSEDPENADGTKGHLEAIGASSVRHGFYENVVKRLLDLLISFMGLVLLSPILLVISLLIYFDDPGPIFFTQKRVGRNKQYFKLHKFRSMKMSTPHDVPTHMLANPQQYITRIGGFCRRHSLDELPQIWDIFIGNMAIIGPRPALWNQDCLVALRDQYDANDVRPGLTGWAQINGRDELEIADKAKLDGDYVKALGFKMDLRCFLGTLHVFKGDESVVEGGPKESQKAGEKR